MQPERTLLEHSRFPRKQSCNLEIFGSTCPKTNVFSDVFRENTFAPVGRNDKTWEKYYRNIPGPQKALLENIVVLRIIFEVSSEKQCSRNNLVLGITHADCSRLMSVFWRRQALLRSHLLCLRNVTEAFSWNKSWYNPVLRGFVPFVLRSDARDTTYHPKWKLFVNIWRNPDSGTLCMCQTLRWRIARFYCNDVIRNVGRDVSKCGEKSGPFSQGRW